MLDSCCAAALKVYGKSLANVDWLHGSAESLLTITNLFIGGLSCSAWAFSMHACSSVR